MDQKGNVDGIGNGGIGGIGGDEDVDDDNKRHICL